ncbi:MAG: transporter [Chryseolinea sp.]
MKSAVVFFCFLSATITTCAQDLDPRAYIKAPVKATLMIANYAHSEGGVVTDPTLPLEDLKATVNTATVGVARTFGIAGRSAQALVVLPYGWVDASALVNGQPQTASRNGLADMRVRLSVLLLGGKTVTLEEYPKDATRTIIGTSITVIAPTGQYYSDKLINLGTRRWSFKPEVALSQKIGQRWLLDAYAGIWFFTNNNTFYPGSSLRTQDPMGSFQAHISYTLKPRMWFAVNSTFYTGGQSTVNKILNDDRQSNVRLGATASFPAGKRSVLKIAYSRGAVVRIGSNFSTVSVGLTTTWFSR